MIGHKVRFLNIVFGAIFLLSCGKLEREDGELLYKDHPIVGTWVHSMNGCDEIFEFTTTGIRMVHANQEIVKAEYEISDIVPEKGIYLVKDTVLEDNGMPDCTGSTSDMSGDVVELILIIQHLPERFSFCFDSQLTSCVGPYVKQ
tara:strand:- start:2670 stop:3104 length:435 start_codon:yes stop_codon:yes gene_type:complete